MSFTGFATAALQLGLQAIVIKPKRGLRNIAYWDASGNLQSLPDIIAQAVVSERHIDLMEITEHPVEQGAPISDHAYKRPSEVIIEMAWSNSPTPSGSILGQAVDAGLAAAASLNSTIAQLENIAGVVGAAGTVMSMLNGTEISQADQIYSTLIQLQETRAIFDLLTGRKKYTNMVCKSIAIETDSKTENALHVTMVCQQIIIVSTSPPNTIQAANVQPAQAPSVTPPLLTGVKSLVSPSTSVVLGS